MFIVNRVSHFIKAQIRWLALVLAIIVIAIASVWGVSYWSSLRTVKLVPVDNDTITITKDSKTIVTTTSAKTIQLPSGKYTVTFSRGSDYQTQSQTQSITSDTAITAPSLDYSNNKLAQLLTAAQPTVQTLLSTVPGTDGYQVVNATLLKRGEWYVAELIPKNWYDPSAPSDLYPRPTNPDNVLDIAKVIAHQTNGQWQIVAGPAITLSIGDYPDIPQSVIRAANKLGF